MPFSWVGQLCRGSPTSFPQFGIEIEIGFETKTEIEIGFEIETQSKIETKIEIGFVIVNKGRIMSNSNKAKIVVAREYLSVKPDHISWADAFDWIVQQDFHEDDNDAPAGAVLEDAFGILVWSQHEDSSIDDLCGHMTDLYDSIIDVFGEE